MKILITGGHLTPALAVIDEIKKTKPEVEIVFVGRKYALDFEKTISLELKEVSQRNIRFINLNAGRLTRVISLQSIFSFLKIPIGFLQAFFIIVEQKPQLVLSFGGYLALPLVFWAWLFRIPCFTHEQTLNPGMANRIISRFAKKIFVAFEETKKYFPQEKTFVVGNPIRETVLKVVDKPFDIKKTKPVIYITGGSLGSHSINLHIKSILPDLLKKYIVIHQTGETKQYHDYEDLEKIKNQLPKKLKEQYFLKKHFFEKEIGYVYSLADLVISRCGANTFFELVALKKPAVLIPLPWSAGREQQLHAEILTKAGCAQIFHQVESSKKLLRLIDSMVKNLDFYKKNFSHLNLNYKKNAANTIVKEIFQ